MGTCCTMVSRMKISSCVQDGLNLSATYNVAMMYHHGLHVKRNAHKALRLLPGVSWSARGGIPGALTI